MPNMGKMVPIPMYISKLNKKLLNMDTRFGLCGQFNFILALYIPTYILT